jgi:hypothetical protein
MLVVRAWLESEPEPQLRARLSQTLDLEQSSPDVTLARSEDDVYVAVRTWLKAFVRHERPTKPRPPAERRRAT